MVSLFIILYSLTLLVFLLVGYYLGQNRNVKEDISGVKNGVQKLMNTNKPHPGVIRSLSQEELDKRRDPIRMSADKEVANEFDRILQNKD